MESLSSSSASCQSDDEASLSDAMPPLSPMRNIVFFDDNYSETEGSNNNEHNRISNNSNDDNDSLLDEDLYTSNKFYGRDMIDYTSYEDESEWYQYLSENDRLEIQNGTKVQPEDWTDRLISDVGEDCELVLDASKKEAMESCMLEVKHIQRRMRRLLKKKTTMIKFPWKTLLN